MMDVDKISYLYDRQLIADLLAEYCRCLDEYDPEALVQTFLEDGIMDQGPGRGGPIKGRDLIAKGIKERQAFFKRTCHHLGQSIVTISGDHATAQTYVTAWHEDWDGWEKVARLRYCDELLKVDGSWKIARRSSHAMGVKGFGEAQWNWVSRHPVEDNPHIYI